MSNALSSESPSRKRLPRALWRPEQDDGEDVGDPTTCDQWLYDVAPTSGTEPRVLAEASGVSGGRLLVGGALVAVAALALGAVVAAFALV